MGFRLEIDQEKCQGCGNCIVVCPVNALSDAVAGGRGDGEERNFGVRSGAVQIYDPEFCTGCGTCVRACGYDAITLEAEVPEESREERVKIDALPPSGDRAEVLRLIEREGALSIEEIARRLGIAPAKAASVVLALKNENRLFEYEKQSDGLREWYTYSTRPPAKKKEAAEEKAAVVRVDPEKAKRVRQSLAATLSSMDVVKIRFLIETGKLDKAIEELVSRVKEE
ncbi:MAG: 4Fe-4S dicluster domain-containing protein [Euryarchaeota archaeon]|nr:4Fe-4S dicluster domain-containing protein [Euryarchaeota archaeon]